MKTYEEQLNEAADKCIFQYNGHLFSNNNDEAANAIMVYKLGAAWERKRSEKLFETLETLTHIFGHKHQAIYNFAKQDIDAALLALKEYKGEL